MSYYYGSSSFAASVWQPAYDDEPSYDYDESDSDEFSPQGSAESSEEEDSEDQSESEDEGPSDADSSSGSHTLYILVFMQPFPGYHWSIYLHPPGDTMGESHDVALLLDSHTWERKTRLIDFITDDRLVWDTGMTAERYLERTEIGDVEDVEEFERVMEDTPVPEGVGPDENCQAWVWNVIRNAVDEGVIGEEALARLRTVRSV
ncbi:hypothetical protein IFR04_013378 [Cadophora malorum]|uniref:Uncharacterized protein n=1 Tax=Cadophora malorum TaxID=108018 RepID=A0A8H7T6R9_9HELO|nr:hypothetical protein IFR04_013378 [Cadophora malorum]